MHRVKRTRKRLEKLVWCRTDPDSIKICELKVTVKCFVIQGWMFWRKTEPYKNRILTVSKRFPGATLSTALWYSFGSTFNLFIAGRRTTLFSVLWYPVRGYPWVTSIFNFSAPRMQGPARDLFCSFLVPVFDVVPAPGEAENRITTSPTGIREPHANKSQKKSPASTFSRGTINKKVKSSAKRPSKFSLKNGPGEPFLSRSKVS